jgi:hypothetical protein
VTYVEDNVQSVVNQEYPFDESQSKGTENTAVILTLHELYWWCFVTR